MYPENMTLFVVDLYSHFVKYLYSYRYGFNLNTSAECISIVLFLIYTAPHVPIFNLIERYPTQAIQIKRSVSK